MIPTCDSESDDYLISLMTKWPQFCIFIWISLKFVSEVPFDDESVLAQVQAPNRRQAITRPSADPAHWGLYVHQGEMSSDNDQGPVLLTLLRHVARILANGRAAFFESCDTIGWNSCDVSQRR